MNRIQYDYAADRACAANVADFAAECITTGTDRDWVAMVSTHSTYRAWCLRTGRRSTAMGWLEAELVKALGPTTRRNGLDRWPGLRYTDSTDVYI